MKQLLFLLIATLATFSMKAQEAVVDFGSPVPMPTEMKGKEWQVLENNHGEWIVYSFKDGKLNLARIDANGNVTQQVNIRIHNSL